MTKLAQAELALLRAYEQARPLLAGLSGQGNEGLCNEHGGSGGIVFQAEECGIIVGGDGSNSYVLNATLIIDLGGQDRYYNNAGGGSVLYPGPGNIGAALVIDLGLANDTYQSDGSHVAAQGAGCLGVGLLADAGGSDSYTAERSALCTLPVETPQGQPPTALASQGTGLFGAGVLVDLCEQEQCSDQYRSVDATQGVGVTGFGLLLDGGGSDSYTVPHTFDSEGVQGAGFQSGFGALVNLGDGNQSDLYDASVADMQAHGSLGGSGILLDQAGNDTYVIRKGLGEVVGDDVLESGWAQGMGEAGGSGILWDLAGNDNYTIEFESAEQWTGILSQGAGYVGAVGILLDDDGNDTYNARDIVQGAGDGAIGLLFDQRGNDRYTAISNCQPGGLSGAFVDVFGLSDVYQCGTQAYDCLNPTAPTERGNGRCWVVLAGGAGKDQE